MTEVEEYVDALKNNKFVGYMPAYTYNGEDNYFPAFTYEHIDELLKYREEKSIITKFPCNPVSSEWQDELELGRYILWTIEYIRIKHIDERLLVSWRFPSQNPVLCLQSSRGVWFFDAEAYQITSDAYYAWWTGNKEKELIEIMNMDPLENTPYEWF
ncbi:MAG: DUF4943 domain-containing protein [Chitinispirillia bacterium]|nr:DUF4943 domain-containing protein [Chitinispirillia bacterium]